MINKIRASQRGHAVNGPKRTASMLFQNRRIVPHSGDISQYLKEINNFPLLNRDREIELAKRIEAGDPKAKEELINSNYRLVVSIAKKYVGRGIPLPGLINEGNKGLIRAAEKFDYRKGYRFATYARNWIRQPIRAAIAELSHTVHIPTNRLLILNQLRKISGSLFQELKNEPTPEKIAERTRKIFSEKSKINPTSKPFAKLAKISAEEVQQILVETQFPLSMESTKKGDKDEKRTLADCLEDHTVPPPDEEAFREILRKDIGNQLSFLTKKEKNAVKLYYGVDGRTQTTCDNIGKMFHTSHENIRQIIKKATKKKLFYNPKLREYADQIPGPKDQKKGS